MSRLSRNSIKDGEIYNGYDYRLQCWIINGIIQKCGHSDNFNCNCYGKIHAGEKSHSVDCNCNK